MRSIFHPDSKLIQWGNKLSKLMAVDLLMLIMCIPILTIGPSVTAMHYVLLHMYRKEDEGVLRMFFKSFKENLLQGMGLTLIYLFFYGSLIYTYYLLYIGTLKSSFLLTVALVIVTILVLASSSWAFILLSRYQDNNIRTLKNAITMIFVKPLYSILNLILAVTPFLGILAFYQFMPIIISLGFAVCGYFQAMLYHRIFNLLEGTADKTEEQEINKIEE
jgi:uncharacterized membrane protein YesL